MDRKTFGVPRISGVSVILEQVFNAEYSFALFQSDVEQNLPLPECVTMYQFRMSKYENEYSHLIG